jgi:hypothetical protein
MNRLVDGWSDDLQYLLAAVPAPFDRWCGDVDFKALDLPSEKVSMHRHVKTANELLPTLGKTNGGSMGTMVTTTMMATPMMMVTTMMMPTTMMMATPMMMATTTMVATTTMMVVMAITMTKQLDSKYCKATVHTLGVALSSEL